MSRKRLTNNRKFILNIVFTVIEIYGAALLPSIIVSFVYNEREAFVPLIAVSVCSLVTGSAGRRLVSRTIDQVRPRICYMTTLFTWLFVIALTVIPFYYAVPGYSVSDALLEASACWTTTGICVKGSAAMPLCMQLLRSVCNWLGGIGIIMITLSLMSSRKFIGWNLASTEFPGPTFLKSDSPFRTGYRKIVLIYAILTLLQLLLLTAAGMDPFVSLLTALSNSSTSGLQHINNGSVVSLSAGLKVIITVFALLGSVNFSVFLLGIRKKFREIADNEEIRVFLVRIAATCAVITIIISIKASDTGTPGFLAELGRVLMQVISFLSTSGYFITDFRSWPSVCILIILLQMFIGSCALSTGGGIKVSRIIIAVKTINYNMYHTIHPSSVRTLTFSKKPMKGDYILRASLFISIFMMTLLLGTLLLTFECPDLYTALNYALAMLTNTGTSIGMPDAAGSAEQFTVFGKMTMCMLMIAGRLEIYPLMMVFFRNFWKSDSSV